VSSGHDDYAVEPIRGLPEALPPDETILWQGAPEVWEMAKHVFHIRLVAAYLLGLTAWRFSVHLQAGNLPAAVVATLSLLTISLLGLGLLLLLAWLCSRTSVYTITSKRIVMRIGVALPTAINIPFAMIGAAGLRADANGTGDISLALTSEDRLAWSNFWPHVRPWRLAKPQPMLRGIANVHAVAGLLGDALAVALPEGTVRAVPAQPAAGTTGVRHAVAAIA
jgi:hypothetical protein